MLSRAESNSGRKVKDRRRQARAWVLAGFVLPLLGGCATAARTPAAADRPSPALQQITARLPGEYISIREEGRPPQSLVIERRSSSAPATLALSMIQNNVDGSDRRRFGLRLETGAIENRLNGTFALLDRTGQAQRSCPMDFHLTGQGLVGETDPTSCQFGEGAQAVGLLKEIAFDGRRISIGDRLVDPATGESHSEDRIIRFLPASDFSGWLGVREGNEWRIARDFELQPGQGIEPLDAAEMSLGVSISLDYYRMQRGEADTLMRLTVKDTASGEIIAESWAEPGSRAIGVALPDLQAGLHRPNR